MMTPRVMEYGRIRPGLYYELATDDGEWAFHVEKDTSRKHPIVGVSVRDTRGQDPQKLSKSFRSVSDARDYIERLQRGEGL